MSGKKPPKLPVYQKTRTRISMELHELLAAVGRRFRSRRRLGVVRWLSGGSGRGAGGTGGSGGGVAGRRRAVERPLRRLERELHLLLAGGALERALQPVVDAQAVEAVQTGQRAHRLAGRVLAHADDAPATERTDSVDNELMAF